jgi:uncharacterized DUF497 family protein
MEFEWDEDKRLGNIAKHDIDFKRATLLFDGRRIVKTSSSYPFEERWLTTGVVDERVITAVWTRREEAIRFISVRRARNGEKRRYYENDP